MHRARSHRRTICVDVECVGLGSQDDGNNAIMYVSETTGQHVPVEIAGITVLAVILPVRVVYLDLPPESFDDHNFSNCATTAIVGSKSICPAVHGSLQIL